MNELYLLWWIVITILFVVSGLSLCFPVLLIKITRLMSRRIDTQADRFFNRRVSIDRLLYRHHFVAGLLIWLVSMATLYLLVFNLDPSGNAANPFGWQPWLFEGVMTLLLVVAVTSCCVGVVFMLRPSVLKPLEAWGNRWITVPEDALDRDLSGDVIDAWVIQHMRLFGLLVFLAAVVIWVLVFGLG